MVINKAQQHGVILQQTDCADADRANGMDFNDLLLTQRCPTLSPRIWTATRICRVAGILLTSRTSA